MAVRQVWRDELWGEHNGSLDPQYSLEDNRLIFLNPITEEGTFHNSGNMNNLANTDSPIGFSGTNFKITEPDSDTIIYQVTDKANGNLVVQQTVKGLSTGKLVIVDEMYDDGVLVQQRRMNFDMDTMEGDVT